MTRRGLLSRALGAAAVVSALDSASQLMAQTPDPLPRIRDSFDFGWRFWKGDAPGAQEPAFADANWRTVDLPHDWSIEGPFAQSEPSGGAGGYAPTGIGWYRKRFRVPASYQDRMVSIEFDGVYQNSEVWINGQYLGKRPFGYISFAYDLTPHLNWSGENVVAVSSGQFAPAEFALVLRLGHLPAYLADGRESGPCGAVGNDCHHPEGFQRYRDGSREDSGAEREGGSSGLYADHGAGRSARQNDPDGGGVAGHRRQRPVRVRAAS